MTETKDESNIDNLKEGIERERERERETENNFTKEGERCSMTRERERVFPSL
jgi:hypothetical protein